MGKPLSSDPADALVAAEPAATGKTSRRSVLTVAAVAVTGAAAGTVTPVVLNELAKKQAKPSTWRFFTDAEAKLLTAVCEQIIPADQDPGATDAGCVNFIDKQLTTHYRRYSDRYRLGLANLQATSRALCGKDFEQLSFDEQTAMLKKAEAGKLPKEHWKDVRPNEFFNVVLKHTMQGFYGSPRHGGNRNYVSYRMLKIEYPRVIGRNKA